MKVLSGKLGNGCKIGNGALTSYGYGYDIRSDNVLRISSRIRTVVNFLDHQISDQWEHPLGGVSTACESDCLGRGRI